MTPQSDWLSSLPGAVRGWPLALLRAGDLADLACSGGAVPLQQDQAGERHGHQRQPLGENEKGSRSAAPGLGLLIQLHAGRRRHTVAGGEGHGHRRRRG